MESNHTTEAIESFAKRTESPMNVLRIGYDCRGNVRFGEGIESIKIDEEHTVRIEDMQ